MVSKGLKGQLEDLHSAIESPQNIAAERTQTTSESTKQPSDEQAKVRRCVMKAGRSDFEIVLSDRRD